MASLRWWKRARNSRPERAGRSDAERPERHADAERRTIVVVEDYRSLRSSVGKPFLTLRVIFLHRSEHMKNPSLCRYHAAGLAIQGL
ncbi:hypothetical protein CVE29_21645 [Pseudomonas syringae pv. actinidiae]|nr:hypothetical protein [Pseudomonas syringae pv. actinidiae]